MADWTFTLGAAGADLVRMKADEEEASYLLLAVIGSTSLAESLLNEVNRRAAVFEKTWRETPHAPSPPMLPTTAALHSVREDVMAGRFG